MLADELSAVGVYRQLGEDKPGTFILESGEDGGSWGRWSCVGCDSLGAIGSRNCDRFSSSNRIYRDVE
ncbi:MAG: hypothetical protein E7L06_02525 [Schaalia turicensis]|nr:hypothetical protein [Schaalia turicensis]